MERFDGPARAAIEGAYRAARELEHSQVGTEHLLLGILAQSGTTAAGALAACGATLDGCRVKVAEAVASKRPGTTAPDLTLTNRASLALERLLAGCRCGSGAITSKPVTSCSACWTLRERQVRFCEGSPSILTGYANG